MGGQPVQIGPFVGGMNTYSGPSAIADNEAVNILNMDVDLDGSLVGRPGIKQMTSAPEAGISHIIGTYRSKTDEFYVVYAFPTTVKVYNTVTGVWINLASGVFTDSVQYNDKLWLVMKPSGATQGGGSWEPVGGYAAIATMPRGFSACVYKERMFIAASVNNDASSINRVKFSNPANPGLWTSTDTFDVSAGDGQDIVALFVFDGSIVIFKTDSTYIFAYESQPTKGQVQIVSSTIGANNNFCIAEYENSLFVLHESKFYRVANWQWELSNVKVPFEYSNSNALNSWDGSTVSTVGNRLIVRYFDRYYVLGTKTGAWMLWEWNKGNGMWPMEFVRDPNVDPITGADKYYSGNQRIGTLWYIYIDTLSMSTSNENFNIELLTKVYDYGVSYSFKRLYWWGVDLSSKTEIIFRVIPVAYNIPITWGQLLPYMWGDLKSWGRLLDLSIDVSDSTNNSNPSNYRTFTKLLKGLRFRQIQFKLNTTSDGTTATGPLRIFSLTSFIDNKEQVVKKVS